MLNPMSNGEALSESKLEQTSVKFQYKISSKIAFENVGCKIATIGSYVNELNHWDRWRIYPSVNWIIIGLFVAEPLTEHMINW